LITFETYNIDSEKHVEPVVEFCGVVSGLGPEVAPSRLQIGDEVTGITQFTGGCSSHIR
jgi:hypothetical protein